MVTRKKKIALVIGVCSVKCAAALGLRKVFEKENIHFDMIVGCSGGSLYATAITMGFERPLPSRIRSVSRYAFYINSLMTNNLLHANFAFHNAVHHAEIIPIFPEFERSIRLFDTDQIPYVISQGEKAMIEQLEYVKRLLNS